MSASEKLRQLGITLPAATAPVAAFVPFLRSERLIFLSGHIVFGPCTLGRRAPSRTSEAVNKPSLLAFLQA